MMDVILFDLSFYKTLIVCDSFVPPVIKPKLERTLPTPNNASSSSTGVTVSLPHSLPWQLSASRSMSKGASKRRWSLNRKQTPWTRSAYKYTRR